LPAERVLGNIGSQRAVRAVEIRVGAGVHDRRQLGFWDDHRLDASSGADLARAWEEQHRFAACFGEQLVGVDPAG
jgi:hypothetical protein